MVIELHSEAPDHHCFKRTCACHQSTDCS